MKYTAAVMLTVLWLLNCIPAIAQTTSLTDIEKLAASPAWPIVLIIIWFLDEKLRAEPRRAATEKERVSNEKLLAEALQRLADKVDQCPVKEK